MANNFTYKYMLFILTLTGCAGKGTSETNCAINETMKLLPCQSYIMTFISPL